MADLVTVSASQADKIIDDEALAEEDLLDELENEEIPAYIREARMEHFKKQAQQLGHMKESGHGEYSDLKTDKEFLGLTTSVEKCVVHFYHADYKTCLIMDTHLEKLSHKHFGTKFAKINVASAPFFVKKLLIRVLPAVLCFINGKVVDRIVGFDQLGGREDFPTSVFEKRLALKGLIAKDSLEDSGDEFEDKKSTNKTIFGAKSKKDDDSDDEDDY